jgi:hypothetical protein
MTRKWAKKREEKETKKVVSPSPIRGWVSERGEEEYTKTRDSRGSVPENLVSTLPDII